MYRASKCLDKIKKGNNQTKTADWYNWEIARLEKTNTMLEFLKKVSNRDFGIAFFSN